MNTIIVIILSILCIKLMFMYIHNILLNRDNANNYYMNFLYYKIIWPLCVNLIFTIISTYKHIVK